MEIVLGPTPQASDVQLSPVGEGSSAINGQIHADIDVDDLEELPARNAEVIEGSL